MTNFSQVFNIVYKFFNNVSFNNLIIFSLSGFLVVFACSLIGCAFSKKIRRSDKKPFLYFLNAYTLVEFAVFVVGFELSQAAFATAIFYFCGYVLYGCLCLIKGKKVTEFTGKKVVSALPEREKGREDYPDVPAAKNSVRLEHALSIADKLLLKNIARGDRQELEKMKTTLAILQLKGELTPQEGAILNENFNALLKLMAKYNL
jgi:hypothetical protein